MRAVVAKRLRKEARDKTIVHGRGPEIYGTVNKGGKTYRTNRVWWPVETFRSIYKDLKRARKRHDKR